VAQVKLSAVAVLDLDRMIITHSLPNDTRARVRQSLRLLERFPRVGRELPGRWRPLRFIIGPWRWLLILYVYNEQTDVVLIATMQDARSSSAATSG
jgi:hypothetical protein